MKIGSLRILLAGLSPDADVVVSVGGVPYDLVDAIGVESHDHPRLPRVTLDARGPYRFQPNAREANMTDGDAPRIVTSTPTIDSGLVLKWWRTDHPDAGAPGAQPVLSVSRDGVRINDYLHEVPTWWIDAAVTAHEALAAGKDDTVKQLVTHRYDRGARHLVEVIR